MRQPAGVAVAAWNTFPHLMTLRNNTIDYLRGIAALMVCFCHFRRILPADFQQFAKTFGELGVQVFFVISGYIIPYSLYKGKYRLANIGRFWLKRAIRLQPAFWVALVLTFVLSQAAGASKGASGGLGVWDLQKSAVYAHIPSENPVIWTLIVELKYYLFISLTFPLFFSVQPAVRRTAFLVAAAAAAVGTGQLDVLRHLPFFLVGFCGCYVALSRAGVREAALLASIAVAAAFLQSTYAQLAAGLITIALILYLAARSWKLGAFYGAISYSLYLIHFPVGVKLLNFAAPRVPKMGLLPLGVVTLGVCTAVAYAIYRLVEKPSSEWSQALKLSPRRPSPGLPVGEDAAAGRGRWRWVGRLWFFGRPARLRSGE